MANIRMGGFRVLPNIVKNIIIINVIIVLLQFALYNRFGINLGDYLGLHYWASPLFRWWQPLTHLFVHGDPLPAHFQETILHIASNMFALWMFGRVLEDMWGSQRFLLFYIICGLGAALCHTGVLTYEFSSFFNTYLSHQPTLQSFTQFINQNHLTINNPQFLSNWAHDLNNIDYSNSAKQMMFNTYNEMINETTVGASGAVFGVLFAFGYLFPNAELMLIFPPIPVKAKWFVGIYALFELYSGIRNSAGDNIAHFAHLGGMLFAFILLRLWKNKIRNHYY